MAYVRRLQVREFLFNAFSCAERDEIKAEMFKSAHMGHLGCFVHGKLFSKKLDVDISFHKLVYDELLAELFPTEKFEVSCYFNTFNYSPSLQIAISWSINEGTFGTITGVKAKQQCKIVLKKLVEKASTDWGKDYCVSLAEVWQTETPQYFAEFFMQYINKKSKYNGTKTCFGNTTSVLSHDVRHIYCNILKLREVM
eukprot:Phypoly_transcript_12584.p1 GENE.Phypoly_transcript_12584~~Phypoly_transcript_12584.p1  ORF type:complete len:197 (+),score=15.80 Phypoly_transcript_12584:509-1099(+)